MSEIESPFQSDDFEVIERSTGFDGFLKIDRISVRYRLFEGGWSNVIQRELQIKPPAVGVLLFDPERDKLVLVRQFRIGLIDEGQSPWLLELVAGMVDVGESPRDVAVRESQEEADCTPQNVEKIAEYYNSPGTSNERILLYCGQIDASQAGGIHGLDHENEDIQVVTVDFGDAVTALEAGKLDNAMTIIAMRWLQLHHDELIKRWSTAAE